jgi:hypothetical protein
VDRGELDAMQRAYRRRAELMQSGTVRAVELWQEHRGVTLKLLERDGSRRVEWIPRDCDGPVQE